MSEDFQSFRNVILCPPDDRILFPGGGDVCPSRGQSGEKVKAQKDSEGQK
jgi:hypothetical protein